MATKETTRFWRAYKDHPDQWEEVSREYVLEYLDGPYRDPQAALDYLIESGTITTPFAIYRSQPPCQSSTGTPVRDWCQVHGFNTQKCRQPA